MATKFIPVPKDSTDSRAHRAQLAQAISQLQKLVVDLTNQLKALGIAVT